MGSVGHSEVFPGAGSPEVGRRNRAKSGEPRGQPCEQRPSSAQFLGLLGGRTWRASVAPAEPTAEILLHCEKWWPQGEPVPRGSEKGRGWGRWGQLGGVASGTRVGGG